MFHTASLCPSHPHGPLSPSLRHLSRKSPRQRRRFGIEGPRASSAVLPVSEGVKAFPPPPRRKCPQVSTETRTLEAKELRRPCLNAPPHARSPPANGIRQQQGSHRTCRVRTPVHRRTCRVRTHVHRELQRLCAIGGHMRRICVKPGYHQPPSPLPSSPSSPSSVPPPPPIHKHPKPRKRASQTLCTVHPSSLTPWTMDASALACRRESLCGGRLAVAGAPRRVASLIVKAHKVGVVPEALDRLDGVVVILGESVLRAARGATARKAS